MIKYDFEVEARLRVLDEEIASLQLVVAWLLNQVPDDAGLKFLRLQANELQQRDHPKDRTLLDVLGELRDRVVSLRE